MKAPIAAICLAAAASLAQAEAFDSTATATGTSVSQVTQIAEGHMLIHTTSTYDGFQTANPDSPMNGMSGDCWGAMEIRVPAVSGGGNCALASQGGDMLFNRWTATGMTADGAILGTWVVIGGTGAFEGASGGGNFVSSTDRATGRFTNNITGAMSRD